MAPVELDAAQHVRSGADHQVGSGVDRRMGELLQVALRVPVDKLVPWPDMHGGGPLGPGVDVDDHQIRLPARLPDERPHRGQIE